MSKAGRLTLKWCAEEILVFLDIYRKYNDLWDTSNENYAKRSAREDSLAELFRELNASGFKVLDEDSLRRKIKNLRDAYRNEFNKVMKSIQSGAHTDDVYKPKLVWYDKADTIWRNVMLSRLEFSNSNPKSAIQNDIQNGTADDNESNKGDDECDIKDNPEIAQIPATQNSAMDMETVYPVAIMSSRDLEAMASFRNRSTSAKNKRSPKRTHIVAHEPPKKILKFKNRSKVVSGLQLQTAVSQLHEIARNVANAGTEDQYDRFANHVASQLRELPLRSFLVLQEKIQSLITKERLQNVSIAEPTLSLRSFQSSSST